MIRAVTDAEIQLMLKNEMLRNSSDLNEDNDSAVLEGSSGLLLSKEEAEKSAANMSPTKFLNSQGEIRWVVKWLLPYKWHHWSQKRICGLKIVVYTIHIQSACHCMLAIMTRHSCYIKGFTSAD